MGQKASFSKSGVSQPWFTPVPTCFGTRKLLCLLELSHYGSAFLHIFVNNLSIYSIIVDKGVICFGSKFCWDKILPLCALWPVPEISFCLQFTRKSFCRRWTQITRIRSVLRSVRVISWYRFRVLKRQSRDNKPHGITDQPLASKDCNVACCSFSFVAFSTTAACCRQGRVTYQITGIRTYRLPLWL